MITGKVIAVDFDGTITKENLYPKIGKLRDHVKEALAAIGQYNCICIWTCRDGQAKDDVIKFLIENNITFNMVNESPYDSLNPNMRKIIADYYIDDHNYKTRIDWYEIEDFFIKGESND